ncbi:MAG TPA: hypothetical protein PLJ25_04060 [Methanothrix sp.]|nr:hypothetical protein [Methanothrix sp.]
MFEANEESWALEVVRSLFDVPSEELIEIGDMVKESLFDPSIASREEAAAKIKSASEGMSQEKLLLAGMFLSGLLRCKLAQDASRSGEQGGEGCGPCCEDFGPGPEAEGGR